MYLQPSNGILNCTGNQPKPKDFFRNTVLCYHSEFTEQFLAGPVIEKEVYGRHISRSSTLKRLAIEPDEHGTFYISNKRKSLQYVSSGQGKSPPKFPLLLDQNRLNGKALQEISRFHLIHTLIDEEEDISQPVLGFKSNFIHHVNLKNLLSEKEELIMAKSKPVFHRSHVFSYSEEYHPIVVEAAQIASSARYSLGNSIRAELDSTLKNEMILIFGELDALENAQAELSKNLEIPAVVLNDFQDALGKAAKYLSRPKFFTNFLKFWPKLKGAAVEVKSLKKSSAIVKTPRLPKLPNVMTEHIPDSVEAIPVVLPVHLRRLSSSLVLPHQTLVQSRKSSKTNFSSLPEDSTGAWDNPILFFHDFESLIKRQDALDNRNIYNDSEMLKVLELNYEMQVDYLWNFYIHLKAMYEEIMTKEFIVKLFDIMTGKKFVLFELKTLLLEQVRGQYVYLKCFVGHLKRILVKYEDAVKSIFNLFANLLFRADLQDFSSLLRNEESISEYHETVEPIIQEMTLNMELSSHLSDQNCEWSMEKLYGSIEIPVEDTEALYGEDFPIYRSTYSPRYRLMKTQEGRMAFSPHERDISPDEEKSFAGNSISTENSSDERNTVSTSMKTDDIAQRKIGILHGKIENLLKDNPHGYIKLPGIKSSHPDFSRQRAQTQKQMELDITFGWFNLKKSDMELLMSQQMCLSPFGAALEILINEFDFLFGDNSTPFDEEIIPESVFLLV